LVQAPQNPDDVEEAKAYIFQVATGLLKVAKHHRIDFLAYLLEMVALASAPSAKKD